MGEIDFEELDKAVNDLMTNVDTSKRPVGLDDPEDKVITIPSSLGANDTADTSQPVASATINNQSNTPVVPTPASLPAGPALAVKRRGQFMDIVHPSLDMNGVNKPIGRHGAIIQPVGSADNLVESNQQDSVPQTSLNEVTRPGASTQPESGDQLSTTSNKVETNTPEPLSTPFLAGAKVEKRPLGEISNTPAVAPPADTIENEPDAQVFAPDAPVTVLPEELGGDIMAVETKDLSSHPEVQNIVPMTPSEVKAADSESAASTTNGSIQQQYTEKPSTGDQTNGSIYDTATYHQAIDSDKPVKKSSPITWIIWVAVLLLVGAAGGAAYFYFTR